MIQSEPTSLRYIDSFVGLCWLASHLCESVFPLITQRSLVQIQPPQPIRKFRLISQPIGNPGAKGARFAFGAYETIFVSESPGPRCYWRHACSPWARRKASSCECRHAAEVSAAPRGGVPDSLSSVYLCRSRSRSLRRARIVFFWNSQYLLGLRRMERAFRSNRPLNFKGKCWLHAPSECSSRWVRSKD